MVAGLLLAVSHLHAQQWYFRTLAGSTGGGGYQDGPARAARFSLPSTIAVCSEALFVADAANHAIRRVSRDGIVSTWAGSLTNAGSGDGHRLDARFNGPTGIAADAQCNLIVADRGNHTIRKIDANGMVTTIAGSAGSSGLLDASGASARFLFPQDVAIESDGTIWVSDAGNRAVRTVSSSGTVKKIATLPVAQVSGAVPLGIALGEAGAYVADYANRSVWLVTRAGSFSRAASNVYAADVVIGQDGLVYVTDYATQLLMRVEANGVLTTVAGKSSRVGSTDGRGTNAQFDHPRGLAVDTDGALLIADEFGCTIRRVSGTADVTTIAATASMAEHVDGTGDVARFEAAYDVDVDRDGVAWVADGTTIRRIARDGTTTTVAGVYGDAVHRDGTRTEARFLFANSIAVESSGSLVVGDGDTIRRVTLDGTVSTLAGTEGTNGFVNAEGDAARFGDYIASIAAGPNGTIYVSDTINKAIRQVSGRTVSTLIQSDLFAVPMGIDTDADGNVYLWDENAPSIFKITPAGQMTTLAHNESLNTAAQGIAIAPDGTVYVGGLRYHALYALQPGSSTIERFAGAEASMGNQNGTTETLRFRSPARLDVAPDGRIFVKDSNRAIRVGAPGEAPEITGFATDSISIPVGGSATLSWSSRLGTARLEPAGDVAPSGSVVVTPAVTTTYSLTVTNAFGEVRRVVTIYVGAKKRRAVKS